MTKEQISELLGRPLTSVEDINFNLYLSIAKKSVQNFLCFDLCDPEDTQVFEAREGYSTVFVPPFTELDEVKLNGVVTEDYSVRQWNKRTGSWYNSLVFKHRLSDEDEVEITGAWGFQTIPNDLQLVIARAFALITKQNKFDPTIKHKRVEDFDITIDNAVDLDDAFYQQNEATLTAYSLCGVGNIQHGSVCRW